MLFALEWKEREKKTSNGSQIASARACNAKPVDIERATFLWVDVDVDVFLFWRLTPRMSRKGKKTKHIPEQRKFSPNPMVFFAVGERNKKRKRKRG